MNDETLRVVFVCQGDLGGPSEKQALAFAQQLAARGHRVMLSLNGDERSAAAELTAPVDGLQVRFHAFRGRALRTADLDAVRAFRATLVHSFNARVRTLVAARAYARAAGAPVFVHWEDDEWSIRRGYGRRSAFRRVARLARRVLAPVAPDQGVFVSRRSTHWAAHHARGHDALTPALAERVRERLGRDCAVVLPVTPKIAHAGAPAPPLPDALASKLLVGFTGEVHPGSVADLELALRATALAQARGIDLAFVHTGKVLPRFDTAAMARAAGVAAGTAIFLGYLPFVQIPPLLRRLDILVQPGEPSDYNRLRLPSKMQAYLESGTPTITFAVGFAELLADGEEVLKLHGFDPEELADRITDVATDQALAQRLARGARAAADRLFDPARNCDALLAHYRAHLGG